MVAYLRFKIILFINEPGLLFYVAQTLRRGSLESQLYIIHKYVGLYKHQT